MNTTSGPLWIQIFKQILSLRKKYKDNLSEISELPTNRMCLSAIYINDQFHKGTIYSNLFHQTTNQPEHWTPLDKQR